VERYVRAIKTVNVTGGDSRYFVNGEKFKIIYHNVYLENYF